MSSQCTCKHKHGASRSVVRQMGDCLPINTGKRLYIQLPSQSVPSTPGIEVRYAATGERLTQEGDGLRGLSYLKEPGQLVSEELIEMEGTGEDGLEELSLVADEEGELEEEVMTGEGNKQLTVDKIFALESELAKLKAQIAVYALAETRDLPIPTAPPPPPPPPPQAQVPITKRSSSSDTEPSVSTGTSADRVPSTPLRPPMAEVLRDLGSVKLRTINAARSPGGTPLRKQGSDSQEPVDTDPASIIAMALKKKFANRVFLDSPGKDSLNQSELSVSEFDSPNVRLQFN